MRGGDMRTSFILAVAAVSVFGVSQASNAATVNSIQGEVLVNSGDGFKPLANAPGDLKAGSQVMVRPGGSAVITYASNCSVRVPSGVWAVQASAPCSAGNDVIDFSTRMNQEVPPPADDATGLVVGGLVVAAGVGAAIILTQGNDNPSSP